MLVRKQAVADMFYPGDKNKLLQMFGNFFKKTKTNENTSGLKAIICPHAGYIYSGQTAAYSYKIIQDNWKKIKNKTIVLLCPSHFVNLQKVSVGLYDELETPLGNIKVDKELGELLINNFPSHFTSDIKAQEKEHSTETQLPFLKYIAGETDFKVLPLVFGDSNPIIIGNILSDISKQKDLFFIVSSDLSHYKDYKEAVVQDKRTINNFLSKDTNKIISGSQACGIYPWLALNEIARQNNWAPKLINYMNSGDTAGDKDRVVGYSSIIYK